MIRLTLLILAITCIVLGIMIGQINDDVERLHWYIQSIVDKCKCMNYVIEKKGE